MMIGRKIQLVLGDNQKSGDNEQFQFIKNKKENDVKKLFGNIGDMDLNDDQKVFEINKDALDKQKSYLQVYETK